MEGRSNVTLVTAAWLGIMGSGVLSAAEAGTSLRYLIKAKTGSGTNIFAQSLVRKSNQLSIEQELKANSGLAGLRVTSLVRTGVSVAEISTESSEDFEAALKGNPLVEYFEKDVSWKVASVGDADNPSTLVNAPWMRDALGLSTQTPDSGVSSTGTPVIVAVVDTGLNVSHPYFAGALAVNQAEANGTPGQDNDGNGYVGDVNGANVITLNGDVSETVSQHGTHVSGLVKAVRDQAIGVAPEARAIQLLPVRFISDTGYGTTAGAIQALEYAMARGARVVNASWGAKGAESYSRALLDTMVDLYNHDIFISVAAGNADYGVANDNDATPFYPANFPIPGLMSVGSITADYSHGIPTMTLSDFSNYGKTSVHIAAPGDLRFGGEAMTGLVSANSKFASGSGLTLRMRGTSMASPVVAGVAAVVRAINPSLTAYEVKQLLISTADKNPELSEISGAASLNAMHAIAAARIAVSHGARPAVSSASSAGGLKDSVGGCGMIANGAAGSEGPFGGNSLGLMTALFVVASFARQMQRHLQRRLRAQKLS